MDSLDNGLDWGSANIFVKNQKADIVPITVICSPHYSDLTWLAQGKGSHRQPVNKWLWLCSSKTPLCLLARIC